MPIVGAHQISKTFGARSLFSGLTFAIEQGDRIGLIGPNGAGKSTLLRMIASLTSADSGTLSLQKGLRVGFLEQVSTFAPEATLQSSILEGAPHPEDWENIALAQETVSKFELDRFPSDIQISTLSGGWKKRIALAREMMKKPDLLLLDEPTNHLDVESILWLENFISKANFATLTITHDRLFLQRIANRILELDPRHAGGLLSVPGDYLHYLDVREQLIASQERREIILKNTLRRETEWLRQGAKARTTKQQARIQRAEDLKQEVEDLSIRNQTRTARLDFQSAEKNPKRLVEARKISKKYGEQVIFSDLDLFITPGSRIGLLGRNGAGKSTLIRVLLNMEEASSGTVISSDQLSVAYFDQTREALDPNVTVSKTLCPSGDHVIYRGTSVHIKSYLSRFLFTPSQMDMAVGKLSGGEQSRLLIARLMLTKANLLVLDEPTNDLDMATLNVLEECLLEFSGAIILVTHDRYFMDQVANKILGFPVAGQGSQLIPFANLSQWEEWHVQAQKVSSKEKKEAVRVIETPSNKKKKLSFKDQRELDSMETNIHTLEKKLAVLTSQSTHPDHASDSVQLAKIFQEIADTQAEIERLFQRWSELE
jgi:ABC transport system ATP-binding/permease protein